MRCIRHGMAASETHVCESAKSATGMLPVHEPWLMQSAPYSDDCCTGTPVAFPSEHFQHVNALAAQSHSRAHGVVASHPLRMRKALGSNPSVSTSFGWPCTKTRRNPALLL